MKTIKRLSWTALIALILLTIGLSIYAVAINDSGSRGMYTVGVGTFENHENAEKLASTIKSYEYSPWIRSYASNGKTTYGVYLGAFDSKGKAEEFTQSIQKSLSFIADYVIVEVNQDQSVIKQPRIVKVITNSPVVITTESVQKPPQTSAIITKDLKTDVRPELAIQPPTQMAKRMNSGVFYTIRIGIFANYKNVKNILSLLKSDNCNPWTKTYLYKRKMTYWVYTEVFNSKDEAKEFAQSMQKKLPNIMNDYVIVNFKPNQPIIKPSMNEGIVAPTAKHTEPTQKSMQSPKQIAKALKPDIKQESTAQHLTQLAKKPNNIYYSVRIGKFVKYENAERLFNVLKADNCNPWIRTYSYKGKVTYWLYAGRFDSKDKAKEFAQSIQKRLSYIEDYVIMGVGSRTRQNS